MRLRMLTERGGSISHLKSGLTNFKFSANVVSECVVYEFTESRNRLNFFTRHFFVLLNFIYLFLSQKPNVQWVKALGPSQEEEGGEGALDLACGY